MNDIRARLNQYQLAPVKTADGKLWAQRCYVCDKSINFLHDPPGRTWVRVGDLVRHRRCYPPGKL